MGVKFGFSCQKSELGGLGKRVLRRIFGRKRDEIRVSW
jgi:hypothetical protein